HCRGVRADRLGGRGGSPEGGGRLLGGEAGEEPELDQLGVPRVLRLELPDGLIQGEQVVTGRLFQDRLDVVEIEPAAAAAVLDGLLAAGGFRGGAGRCPGRGPPRGAPGPPPPRPPPPPPPRPHP